jgi:methyl-accepting chemotaxis protein
MTKTVLSIRQKLIASFLFLCAMMATIALLGGYGISQLTERNRILGKTYVPATRFAGELRGGIIDVRVSILNHVLYREPAHMDAEEKALAIKSAAVAKTIAELTPLIEPGEEEKLFKIVESGVKDYVAGSEGVLARSRAGEKAEAVADLLKNVRPHIKVAAQALEELLTIIEGGE